MCVMICIYNQYSHNMYFNACDDMYIQPIFTQYVLLMRVMICIYNQHSHNTYLSISTLCFALCPFALQPGTLPLLNSYGTYRLYIYT